MKKFFSEVLTFVSMGLALIAIIFDNNDSIPLLGLSVVFLGFACALLMDVKGDKGDKGDPGYTGPMGHTGMPGTCNCSHTPETPNSKPSLSDRNPMDQ